MKCVLLSPVVQIGFEETLYTVSEGDGTVQVDVAVLPGGLSNDVVVTLVTQDADAEGKLQGLQNLVCVSVYFSEVRW